MKLMPLTNTTSLTTCPHCRKKVKVRYNKAKNLTYYKNKK